MQSAMFRCTSRQPNCKHDESSASPGIAVADLVLLSQCSVNDHIQLGGVPRVPAMARSRFPP